MHTVFFPRKNSRHGGRTWFGWSLWPLHQSLWILPIPTSKEILHWRFVGSTCLVYAGENTGTITLIFVISHSSATHTMQYITGMLFLGYIAIYRLRSCDLRIYVNLTSGGGKGGIKQRSPSISRKPDTCKRLSFLTENLVSSPNQDVLSELNQQTSW